jgi:diaminopimelate decarboxylase
METIIKKRLQLFPLSVSILSPVSVLTIASLRLDELAETHGTPLYLYDEFTMASAADSYRRALDHYYPAESGITYAGKAFLNLAMAQWVKRQGLLLDCTGAGEIYIAATANLGREQILVHGVNKNPEDLDAALAQAGIIVIDNLAELNHLVTAYHVSRAARIEHLLPDLWLRLRPGIAVDTHEYRQTGQEDSKFGLSTGETFAAIQLCLENRLPLRGLHFHQGSHFHDPSPLAPALDTLLDLLEACKEKSGWQPDVISPGGGWGVPYHEEDLPHPEVEQYVAFTAEKLASGCRERDLKLPRLQLEPGRSIVARAGVAVYRVGAVKRTLNRRWLMLDGGMTDNPRPALYGARYTALPVNQPERPITGPAWLAGPFCESGDILIRDLPMADILPGEYVAVPVSGAYQLSMSSNYNGARRPTVLWLDGTGAHVIQRRETLDDLLRRDAALAEG